MGQSVKAVLQFALLIAVGATLVSWTLPRHVDATVWTFRFGSPILAAMLGWLWFRSANRAERLPDLLREAVGPGYFERDGMCFAPVIATGEGGSCQLLLMFQNRYANGAKLRVVMKPPRKTFSLGGRLRLPEVDTTVACGGAEYGVRQLPFHVPPDYAGKTVAFDVTASTDYPAGRGARLRYREGTCVGEPTGAAAQAAVTGGLLLVGVVRISTPASIRLTLPAATPDDVPAFDPVTEILWKPDLPTGGFPVDSTPAARVATPATPGRRSAAFVAPRPARGRAADPRGHDTL